MFMSSKAAIESIAPLRQNLAKPEKKDACIAELEEMIRMKESHLERAEWASCCGDMYCLVPQIDSEISLLQDTLDTLKEGDRNRAVSLLEDYIAYMKKNYAPEHPNHW